MPKPSQTMLDKLLFNWCYPNSISYIIIPDSSGGGTVVTKCAIIKQSTLITAPRGGCGVTYDETVQ